MNAKVTKWARSNRGNTLTRHAVSRRDLAKYDRRREVLIAYCGTELYSGAVWVEGEGGANSDLQTLTPCKRCTVALEKVAAEIATETAVHANTPGRTAIPLCGKRYGAVPADGRGVNCPACAAVLSVAEDDAAIEAADDAEARRTGGTFAAKYLGPVDGWDGRTMPRPASTRHLGDPDTRPQAASGGGDQ